MLEKNILDKILITTFESKPILFHHPHVQAGLEMAFYEGQRRIPNESLPNAFYVLGWIDLNTPPKIMNEESISTYDQAEAYGSSLVESGAIAAAQIVCTRE